MNPGEAVVLPLNILFEIAISPPAWREAPHRKLLFAVTLSIAIELGVTTCKPYPRKFVPWMIFVPEKKLLLIATGPPELIFAPTSRFPLAMTLNSEVAPVLTISKPVICRRPLAGLLNELLAMVTFRPDLIMAPAVLFRSNFESVIVTSPLALSSAPAPFGEFVTLTFDSVILFCEESVRPLPWTLPVGLKLRLRLLIVSEPPHGFALEPMRIGISLKLLVVAGSTVPLAVFHPPVTVRSALLMLLKL